jgi:hypothetical protein
VVVMMVVDGDCSRGQSPNLATRDDHWSLDLQPRGAFCLRKDRYYLGIGCMHIIVSTNYYYYDGTSSPYLLSPATRRYACYL